MKKLVSSKNGFSTLRLVIFLAAFFLLVLIGDLIYIYYSVRCGNASPFVCFKTSQISPISNNSVLAKGYYVYKNNYIEIILNVPLSGGKVSGSFSGICRGVISGEFEGRDGGVISGIGHGSCSPYLIPIPVSADFTGNADFKDKAFPVNIIARFPWFSENGSLTLNF